VTCCGRWSTEDEKGKRFTTDRYTGWAGSGRCSERPEDKEIERERDQRRGGSVEHQDVQSPAFQSAKQGETPNRCRDVSAKQTHSGEPELAGFKL